MAIQKKRIIRKAVLVNRENEVLVKAEERNSQMAAAIEENKEAIRKMDKSLYSAMVRTMECEHAVWPTKKEMDMNDRLVLIKERHMLMQNEPTLDEVEEQEEFIATLKEDTDEGLEEVDVASLIGDTTSEGVAEVAVLTNVRPKEILPVTEGLREQMLRLGLDPESAIDGDDAIRSIRWAEEDKKANMSLLKSFCEGLKDNPSLYEEIVGTKLPEDPKDRNTLLNEICRDGWDEQHLDAGFKNHQTHSVGQY